MAVRTFLFDDLTAAVTVRTGLYISYRAKQGLLCIYDLTFTAAFRTGLRGLVPGFAPVPWQVVHSSFRFRSSSFSQPNTASSKVMRTAVLTLAPFIGPLFALSAAAAAEKISENITKDISHIAAVEIKAAESSGTSAALFKRSMSELIILSAFFRIAQYGICLGCLLKLSSLLPCLPGSYRDDIFLQAARYAFLMVASSAPLSTPRTS